MVGNTVSSVSCGHEKSSRGRAMSYFVHGSDDKLNFPHYQSPSPDQDQALWYFDAPSWFLEDGVGIAYGGELEFTLSAFSGDFSKPTDDSSPLVVLECDVCALNTKTTLSFPLSAVGGWDGSTKTFSLPLTEDGGWLQDPENTLTTWSAPSKCSFIEVLSNISRLKILGDHTSWYESVGLDNVSFKNLKGQLPICAQGSPDATICSCD